MKTKLRKRIKGPAKKLNNRGIVLIMSYFVLTVLFTLTAGFALKTVNELRHASRYRDNTASFWLAEAGVQQFIQDNTLLDAQNPLNVNIPAGSNNFVAISKDDSDVTQRIVTATGNVNGLIKQVQVIFPGTPPDVFNNTMATGGDLDLIGALAKMHVFGLTRITGAYTESGIGVDGWFEDKVEGVAAASTTLAYPDADISGTGDEFNDFVEFNRTIAASYPPEEVVYIQSDATQVIYPNSSLIGKKLIFVEGSTAGAGDVDILFDASWQDDQNLTVISTGRVDYVQPLQTSANSKLNVVAWDGYVEASVLYSAHSGVTYSHDEANLYSVFSYSETTGNLIANNGINANEALTWKKFLYANPIVDGQVPPGFQGLISQSPGGYSTTPNAWKEI